MDEKKVKIFKMKKLNERLLTAPNAPNGTFRHRSSHTSPQNKEDKPPQKQAKKIKDLLNMIIEPPNMNLDNQKINQMCSLYPEFMQNKFNRNSEIKGGTNTSDYNEHINRLKMDSYDDMKIPIETQQEQQMNNQFNYLYSNMPPPSNKLFNFLNRRGTASTGNPGSSSSRRRCYTPNQLSARSTTRSPEDTLRYTKNTNKLFNVQFYDSYSNNASILDACKQRGEKIKLNELNNSSRLDNIKYFRANSAQDNNDSQFQKTQNSFAISRSNVSPDTFYRRNISTSQSKRSDHLRLDNKAKQEDVNISHSNSNRALTQGDVTGSPRRNKDMFIKDQESHSTRFITDPAEIHARPHTTTTSNFQKKSDHIITNSLNNFTQNSLINNPQINKINLNNNSNAFINYYSNDTVNELTNATSPTPTLSNLKKKEKQEKAEWRYIEFVHKRRSLSMTPDCQKVNQIIRRQQLNQIPKNCSLNAQIERSQLQRYFDQYLITSKPATPTKIKDIRQRLAVNKDILREQGIENDYRKNPVKQKISEILKKSQIEQQSSSEPSFITQQNLEDPNYFLKNRLSPSKINYKDKNINYEDMEDAIPEVQDEDNYQDNTPKKTNSSPQMQNDKKYTSKLEEVDDCTSQDEDIDEEDLQIYREGSDDDYDDDDLEEKQKKLEVLKKRKARRSKDIRFWEKTAKESFIKSPDNDQKHYLRNTESSQKQRRLPEENEEGTQKRRNSLKRNAFAQVNTILNACHQVSRQNKIDNKLFKKAHNTVNKNISKFQQFLPKGEEEEENFEEDIKDIIRDEKLHDFLQKQMIQDYEDSLQLIQASRTQNQQISDLSRPKELINYVKNNILDSVIRNPAFYNHLLTDTRKKKLQEDKVKIKSYVNQQDKDMSKLVRYSDFISFK